MAGSAHWSPFDASWIRRSVYNSIKWIEKRILEFIELYNEREGKTYSWLANIECLLFARKVRYYLTGMCTRTLSVSCGYPKKPFYRRTRSLTLLPTSPVNP